MWPGAEAGWGGGAPRESSPRGRAMAQQAGIWPRQRVGEDTGQGMVGSGLGQGWVFLRNLNINSFHKQASPDLGIYSRQTKTCDFKKIVFLKNS